ncbi:MAG: class I SAM-dependent methyltransferase [Deltaproteobacteria bacterium]|nr:class I SAM-dependent methyltransferase [Deltaproteobacteria bacterium]
MCATPGIRPSAVGRSPRSSACRRSCGGAGDGRGLPRGAPWTAPAPCAALGPWTSGGASTRRALAFARQLADDSGLHATFHQADIKAFLAGELEPQPFDVAFGSYGCLPWIDDLPGFFSALRARLAPGGRVVVVEIHPLAWSFDARFQLADPYFAPGRLFSQPVGDYVGAAAGALSPSGHLPGAAPDNPHPAHAFQHTVADIVTALLDAGLELEALREWPYVNGCRVHDGLVPLEGRRFTTPPGVPSLPLMLGLAARSSGRPAVSRPGYAPPRS